MQRIARTAVVIGLSLAAAACAGFERPRDATTDKTPRTKLAVDKSTAPPKPLEPAAPAPAAGETPATAEPAPATPATPAPATAPTVRAEPEPDAEPEAPTAAPGAAPEAPTAPATPTADAPAETTPPKESADAPKETAAAPAVPADAPKEPAGTKEEPAAGPEAALAPDFTLPDTNGTEHRLADSRGKVVVLEWVNHGCPYVKKHYGSGNMQRLQKAYVAKGVVWFTICSSAEGQQGYMSADAWNETIKANGTSSTAVLMDPAGGVGLRYDAKTTPHMFVIDPQGKLVYHGAIDDKPTTDPADVEGARSYLVEAVEAALAGKPVETTETKPYGCTVKYAATAEPVK